MKKLIFLVVLATCARAAFSQTTVLDSMLYAGVMRHVRVYIPATRKCSMILHLHGYSSTAALEQAFTNYMPVADTAGFLVAYPDGLKDNLGNQYWNVGWSVTPNTDDVSFLSALIDTLIRRYRIDPNAVFASGLSNGGFMCHKLACELSNKIGAIASVSASMTTDEYASCAPLSAVPVMEIHGTADATVPYAGITGTSSSASVDSVIMHSAALDHCNPVPSHSMLPHNVNTTNGSTVDHYVYTGGLQGSTCELYKINGGQHVEWAGVAGNFDFNASREIWRFFRDFRSGNCTNLGATNAAGSRPEVFIYPNPFNENVILSLRSTGLKTLRLSVVNVFGQVVFRLDIPDMQNGSAKSISLSHLSAGIYSLQIIGDGFQLFRSLMKQ